MAGREQNTLLWTHNQIEIFVVWWALTQLAKYFHGLIIEGDSSIMLTCLQSLQLLEGHFYLQTD